MIHYTYCDKLSPVFFESLYRFYQIRNSVRRARFQTSKISNLASSYSRGIHSDIVVKLRILAILLDVCLSEFVYKIKDFSMKQSFLSNLMG